MTPRRGLGLCASAIAALAPHCAPVYVEVHEQPGALDGSADSSLPDAHEMPDAGVTDARVDGDAPSDAGGPGCHAGGSRCAFITSVQYGANLGGLTGADAKCQARANAANLTGTYKAWLSDSTGSPSTRFTQGASGWTLVNGAVIASTYADLIDGTVATALAITELGTRAPAATVCASSAPDGGTYLPPIAWSNTAASGAIANVANSCSNWTGVLDGGASWGIADRVDNGWSNGCTTGSATGCTSYVASLYCFEQ